MTRKPESQLASSVLMIRPARFESNPFTAESNRFQGRNPASPGEQQKAAEREFEGLAQALRDVGINVVVIEDTSEPHTPDAVFPNNWVSFHADGTVVLYPMEAPNRRTERRQDVLDHLVNKSGFHIKHSVDLSYHEMNGHYLEGTGSLVLDRVNRIAYACLSSRTHPAPLEEFAKKLGYQVRSFDSVDQHGSAIYHTNVMMMVGEEIAVICAESVPDNDQREAVLSSLKDSGHEVVTLSFSQMESFAGNMLELRAKNGERIVAMSRQADESLTSEQLDTITRNSRIVSSPIENIESSSGGSVRCMLAEIHLPS